jgi:predicted DNA-binding transcriptional regulator YafY
VSKLERLLNLTAALLGTGRSLTAAELQERIADYPEDTVAFRRAFERDKDDLREMGVPIQRITLHRPDGRETEAYRIRPEDYYLRDPDLDLDELAALHLAAAAVRMDGVGGAEALWKLGGRPDDARSPVGPVIHLPSDARLADLFGAVAERRVVRFRYQGEERELEPHRLDFRRGRWYLTGHDRHRDAERNFRLDRIDGDVTTGPSDAFARPEAVGAAASGAWELGDEPPVDARLLVDRTHALWAAQHFGDDVPREERADGSVVFTLRVTNRAAFRGFVLGFLEHAEIVDPPELRADIVEWLEAL